MQGEWDRVVSRCWECVEGTILLGVAEVMEAGCW